MVLEKTLESPLDSKEIKPVNPKGNQPWIFIGRTNAEAEAPVLWPPDAKSWLHWKSPWRWERLRAGGEGGDRGYDGWVVGWYQLNGHEFEQTPGDSEDREAWNAAVHGVAKNQTQITTEQQFARWKKKKAKEN